MPNESDTNLPIPQEEAAVITPELMNAEVDSSIDAVNSQHKAIRDSLAEVDKSVGSEDGMSLVDTWDRITQFKDTNELIRINLLELQHMAQEAWQEHQKWKADDNQYLEHLRQIAKMDPEQVPAYQDALEVAKQRRNDERNSFVKLANTALNLAKEYRSCAMQRAMFVHISLIQQFTILMTSSVQRNIKDPNVWKAISNDLKNAKQICFPVQEEKFK